MLEPKENTRDIEVTDDEYDEFLDYRYGYFTIGYIKFDASRILSELDPIAYSCGKSDYEDSLESETVWECPICGTEFDDDDAARYCCQTDDEEIDEEAEEID